MKLIPGKLTTNFCHRFLKMSGLSCIIFLIGWVNDLFRIIESLARTNKINEKQSIMAIVIRAYVCIPLFQFAYLSTLEKPLNKIEY